MKGCPLKFLLLLYLFKYQSVIPRRPRLCCCAKKFCARGYIWSNTLRCITILSLPQAVTDAPCCLFVEELIDAYPDAKVILTTRTAQSWLKSMGSTVLEVLSWRSWTILSYLDREYSQPYWSLFNRSTQVWSGGLPPYKRSSYPALLQNFENHSALVRRLVPKENLLEFHPSQGWGPFCGFLDLPVPESSFPHINDGEFYVKIHKSLYWQRWLHVARNTVKILSVPGIVLVAGWWMHAR